LGTTLDRTGGAAAVIGKAAELLGGEAVISPVAAGVVGLTALASSWLPAAPVGAWATVQPASMTTTLASSAVRHARRGTCVDLGATSSTVRIADRGRLPRRRPTRAEQACSAAACCIGRPVLLHVSQDLLHVVDERVIPGDGRGNLVVTEARAILSDGQ
jgi:hypothetical protein